MPEEARSSSTAAIQECSSSCRPRKAASASRKRPKRQPNWRRLKRPVRSSRRKSEESVVSRGLSMLDKQIRIGLTYDDVVLVPAKSQVLPTEVETTTFFSRNIQINIPIVSSAMDTVTEARLAIAIAREGGIGVVHRVFSPQDQAAEVDKVKKSESGMILDPVTISPDQTIRDAHALMERYRISGIPVTKNGKLVGILTNRDLRFEN